jgi:hypothetical protein
MPIVELFVPIGAFVAFVVVVSLICRLIATASLNRTIREAVKSDPKSVPILADRLDRHAPWGDALLGWVLIALAAGLAILAMIEGDPEQRSQMLRATVIPLVVGLAVLAYARFSARDLPKA